MRIKTWIFAVLLGVGIALVGRSIAREAMAEEPASAEDFRSWGEDHVGQEVPEYTTGTECLFCHRDYVAPRWRKNPHNRTMREAEKDDPAMQALRENPAESNLAGEVEILLGSGDHVRYLKRLPAYGQAAMSSSLWHAEGNKIVSVGPAGWHPDTFGPQCAGCHATAIDTETVSFGTPGLDCYVCHGILELEHANDDSITLFAKNHDDDPRVVISVCGQCHLRGGKSKATGRPYPTVYVPGDNLFRDFEVDWSDQALAAMDLVDRHVFENARDVMTGGTKVTCNGCHSIHGESTEKHQELEADRSCETCHRPGKAMSEVDWPKTRSNKTCKY